MFPDGLTAFYWGIAEYFNACRLRVEETLLDSHFDQLHYTGMLPSSILDPCRRNVLARQTIRSNRSIFQPNVLALCAGLGTIC